MLLLFLQIKKKIYDIKEGKYAISCKEEDGPCFVGAENGCGYYNISIRGNFYLDNHTGNNDFNSYKINSDFELNNGEKDFQIKELEIFQVSII